MSVTGGLSLFGVMVLLAALPSASVALVVTRSATLGTANGVAVALGIVLGDIVFVLLAILGLAVVAERLGGLFMIVRWLGAMYLLWLGYGMLTCAAPAGPVAGKTAPKRDLLASVLAGLFLTLGDVKAIVFYLSLFPVFVDMSALRPADVATVIGVTILSVGGVKIAYAMWASRAAALSDKRGFNTTVRKTAGGLLIGAGAYLVLKT